MNPFDPMLVVKASAILAAADIFTNEELIVPANLEQRDLEIEKLKVNSFFEKQKTLQQDFINSFCDKEKVKDLEQNKNNLTTMIGILTSF